jgi:very-short-patch-repair endonuclease
MPRLHRSNSKIKHRAGKLPKELTPAERKLWARLRNDQLGINFRRQHAIGNYIPDFCSPKAKLIIELDGSQHLEQAEYDEYKTLHDGNMIPLIANCFWGIAHVEVRSSVYRAVFGSGGS